MDHSTPASQSRRALNYPDIMQEAEKPISRRQQVPDQQGKLKSVRKYHKTRDKLAEYWVKRSSFGGFINPFERDGAYKAQVEALIVLGTDQWHSHKTVIGALKPVMEKMKSAKQGNAWIAFANKEIRQTKDGCDAPSAKDLGGRVTQNFEVLQRLSGGHQYGFKLSQAHAAVDIKFVPLDEDPETFDGNVRDVKGIFYYRLNTAFNSPEEVMPLNNYKGKRRGRPKKKK